MADVTMPQLGETVTEGTITKWNKAVGDEVAEDEILFEVSTDKVDSEVPSPVAGTLTEIKVQEGDTAEVGAVLAVIGDGDGGGGSDGGGEAADSDASDTEEVADDDASGEAPTDEDEPETDETGGNENNEGAAAIDLDATEPEQSEADAKKEETGKDDKADRSSDKGKPAPAPKAEKPKKDAEEEAPPAGDSEDVPDGPPSKPALMSPVVRKLVGEHNLDVSKIKGTGLGGRITRSDVMAAAKDGGAVKSDQAAKPDQTAEPQQQAKPQSGQQSKPQSGGGQAKPASSGGSGGGQAKQPAASKPAPQAPAAKAAEGDEVISFSRIRKVTANHMVMSKSTSAHTTTAIEVDFHGVETVRQANKAKFKEQEGTSLTYLPFIARAVVDAIREFPHVNSSVGDEELIVRKNIDLGIAVDMNFNGLLVPVIRQADNLRLRAIARSVADLAGRARNKKISPDDLSGGTFTITNPGPFGSLFTIAVINQPQTAILSTDGVKKKPVVVTMPDGTDGIAIHPVGLLVLTWDHRAFDGAYAAAFNARVKEILETRDWAAEF